MKLEKINIKLAKKYLAAIRGEFLNIYVFGARVKWPLNVIWRWPPFGGSLYRKTMGKRLELSVSGRYLYLEVAAIQRFSKN